MRRSLRQIDRSQHTSLSELNITPLLDLVFVLLVIFIIVTPQLTNNMELSLPSGTPTPPDPAKARPVRILITAQGRILLNETDVTMTQLHAALKQMQAANPQTSAIVGGSGDANYQKVVAVLDVIQQLEITNIGLATETAEQ